MKVVVVTGAASGLGWALAQGFHARGDHVWLLDRDGPLLSERAGELGSSGRVSVAEVDLTDPGAMAIVVSRIMSETPRVDVLVNNAGITHRSPAILTRPAVIRKVVEVDFLAVVELTIALYPSIELARGCVVNISSMAGWMPVPGRAGYCAAKSAMHQFFETFRVEVQDRGVSVLMVYPSFLATAIDRNALGADGQPARHARSTTGRVRSAEWMASRIMAGLARGDRRIFPDRLSAVAALFYRIAPDVYLRLMRRIFSVELP